MRLSQDFPNNDADIEAQATLLCNLILCSPAEDRIERNCRNADQKLGPGERFLLPLHDAIRLRMAPESPSAFFSAVLHKIDDEQNKSLTGSSEILAFIDSFSELAPLSADLKSLLASHFSLLK
jgi:hypothetical protein